ncbi:MAG: transposase [Armatimonadetes bacterium]|nr:transposase [Armatimonadota bacterium]
MACRGPWKWTRRTSAGRGKRGRGAAGKALVVIAAQLDGGRIGRIRLKQVPDASGASLEGAVRAAVEPGSTICTEDWSGYRFLSTGGYTHQVVRATASVGEDPLPQATKSSFCVLAPVGELTGDVPTAAPGSPRCRPATSRGACPPTAPRPARPICAP